jgi:hypothetical protein
MTHDLTRRDVMKGGAAAAALVATSVPLQQAAAQGATVSGVVFEDRSGTGRRQAGDPGIPGVLVSNGREVAKTDADGRYSLPFADEEAVFVIKPTGYMVPVEPGTMLPRFYYLHQPKGTPAELGLRYRGIDPTGPLPASVDFALRKADEPTAFEVLLFTDPQPESPTEVEFVRDDVVSALIGTNAAFGMTTGDVTFDDLSFYPRQNRIIGQIGVPWWNIPGNHDLNFEAPGTRYSRETFKRVFGPTSYAFEYGGALFVMLDNVEYLGTDPTRPHRDGKYQGRIGERQRAFIANLLAEQPADRLVVVAMHIPLRTYLNLTDPAVNTIDRAEFLQLIGDRPCVSFSGHTHTTEHHYFDAADGYTGASPHHHHVMTAVCGSWWSGPFDHRGIATADSRDGSPNGFHVLAIDGNKYTTRFQPAKEARQMRISLDSEFHRDRSEVYRDVRMGALLGSPIPRERTSATEVVVNFFDGGPRSTVAYRIGTRAPVTMTRDSRIDPFVQEVFARNEATKKPWVKASPSSHIWVARLPADLEAGTHLIEVQASDEYGRTHRDHLVLEVTAGEATPNMRG